jgi:membrane protease YdiL (CAAX protease family)
VLNLPRLSHSPAPARIAVFILVLLCLWVPFAAPIYLNIPDRNTVSILTLLILYAEFILLVRVWGHWVYGQPKLLWSYGLELTRQIGRELLVGLAIGGLSLFALFATQSLFGWVVWQTPKPILTRIILEGLLVSLGFGFAEELLFRGWLLDELQRDYRPSIVLWVDALAYALLHFIKPLDELQRTFITFPALVLLGLTLVWAKRSCPDLKTRWGSKYPRSRLGLPIGLHAGLVWGYYIVNVGQLVQFSDRVPAWVTGIDHNPLAGIMGLLFLGCLAGVMRWRARGLDQPRRPLYR